MKFLKGYGIRVHLKHNKLVLKNGYDYFTKQQEKEEWFASNMPYEKIVLSGKGYQYRSWFVGQSLKRINSESLLEFILTRLPLHEKTIKQLFTFSGNKCAMADCDEKMIVDGKVIGEICHIEAANMGGSRYNSKQSEEERRSFENLILLCPTHHKLSDNVEKFSVEYLRKIKKIHESKISNTQLIIKENDFSKILEQVNTSIEKTHDEMVQFQEKFEDFKKVKNNLDEDKLSAYKQILDAVINMNGRFFKIYQSDSNEVKNGEALILKKVLIPREFRPLKNNNRLYYEISKQFGIYCTMLEMTSLIPNLDAYNKMINILIRELENHIPEELSSLLSRLKNNLKNCSTDIK